MKLCFAGLLFSIVALQCSISRDPPATTTTFHSLNSVFWRMHHSSQAKAWGAEEKQTQTEAHASQHSQADTRGDSRPERALEMKAAGAFWCQG